jgi:circadian clock protein KaiB
MPRKQVLDSTKAFEQSLVGSQEEGYVLRLYITGITPQSVRAIANVKKICEEHLQGRYELDVVDLYQQPQLAAGEQIGRAHV